MSTQETPIPAIDVRVIPPRDRHPLIFASLEALKPRGSFMIVSDHEPRPLQYQLQTRFPGLFDWRFVEQGPETWRVVITREGGSDGGAAAAPDGHRLSDCDFGCRNFLGHRRRQQQRRLAATPRWATDDTVSPGSIFASRREPMLE